MTRLRQGQASFWGVTDRAVAIVISQAMPEAVLPLLGILTALRAMAR